MKWTLRITGALLLIAALALFGAWFFFPWLTTTLLKKAASGQGIEIRLQDNGRPTLSGLRLGQLSTTFTTPVDSCTGIASTYRISLRNSRVSWRLIGGEKTRSVELFVDADSIALHQMPADIRFSQASPHLRARIDFSQSKGLLPDIAPDSLSFLVSKGRIETGQLRLEEASYAVLLTRSHNWVQQPARFRAISLFTGNVKAPLSGFEATFGLKKKPALPCTLFFNDCTVDLYGIRAHTPEVAYSLRNKHTTFELKLDSVPLDRFSPTSGPASVSGKVNGSVPIEFLNSTIRIKRGVIDAAKGTAFTFRTDKTNLTFDAGRRAGGAPFISNLNVKVSLDASSGATSAIRLDSLSAKVFEGRIGSTPASFDPGAGTATCTIRIDKVPILDRIKLKGEFSGGLNGSVSGVVPIRFDRNGLTLRNTKIRVQGGGSIRQKPSGKEGVLSAESVAQDILWDFRNPSVTLDMDPTGSTKATIALESLKRTMGGNELLLGKPQGTITLTGKPGKPSRVSITDFTATLFNGSIAIDSMDYDLKSNHGETRVQLDNIPIQTLIDLQGTNKLSATGTLTASIPVVLDNNRFSIPEGRMNAEREGIINYSTTPEERAASGAGMRLTYEALSNFFYSELVSTIVMEPSGDSRIAIQISGHNPEFQNNRPVNLNLNIEQNLLELFRSLSISSEIEENFSKQLEKRSTR